jgi:hypothetical protein
VNRAASIQALGAVVREVRRHPLTASLFRAQQNLARESKGLNYCNGDTSNANHDSPPMSGIDLQKYETREPRRTGTRDLCGICRVRVSNHFYSSFPEAKSLVSLHRRNCFVGELTQLRLASRTVTGAVPAIDLLGCDVESSAFRAVIDGIAKSPSGSGVRHTNK